MAEGSKEAAEKGAARWTDEQELAITARGSNLLVSAAAGAGKTAVLVERVIRLVLQRVANVDQLLVVTFTEAAAAELRDRLAGALRDRLAALESRPGAAAEDEVAWLHLQLALLGRASISTLHAFCLSVVRRYFHRLGLDPGLEVLAEEEAGLLRDEVVDQVFEELYERADPDFLALVEAYGSERDDRGLRDTVLRLHDFARSHPDPEGWLDRAVSLFEVPPGTPVEETVFGRAAIEDITLELEAAADRLRFAEATAQRPDGPAAYGPVLAEDILRVRAAARTAAQGWESLVKAVAEAAQFPSLPRIGKDQGELLLRETAKRARNGAKKTVRDLAQAFDGRSGPDLLAETRALARPMRTLASLVTRFDAAYRQAKDGQGKLDFSDLEHYCLAALSSVGDAASGPAEAAAELRDRYVEVLVDEYQDINEVQERILTLVSSGTNLFMVGDVKQSIYRFRLADPTLFGAKYESYLPLRPGDPPSVSPGACAGASANDSPGASAAAAGRRIVLPDNFRSRKTVLDAVNFVFRQIMRKDVAELDYSEEAELRYGAAAAYGAAGAAGPAVELHLLEGDVRAAGGGADGRSAGDEDAGEREAGGPAGTGDEGDGDEAYGTEDTGGGARSPAGAAGDQPSLEDLHIVEREAGLVAERIGRMLGGPERLEIYDKDARSYRPARYGDIAILMRATSGLANLVVETLTRAGIPATAQLSTGYFAATEVETVLSLLRLIDNPRQDIPLAAVLRSPIVGLDENDLAAIRLHRPITEFYEAVVAAAAEPAGGGAAAPITAELAGRLRSFLARLDTWRDAARRGPLSVLIWSLYRETGFYAYAGGLPGGAQRQANLRGLYDRARAFDQFSRQGLARFLRFIDHLRESGGDLGPPQPVGEGENAVRVMSIHRSKGLEFPVVFLLHLGKRFNLSDAKGDLICHHDLGFGPIVADTARRLKYPSLASRAVAHKLKAEAVAEEMRCLYVAMTRARDCLVLVGTKRDLPHALAEWCLPLSPARIAGARSCLDWLVPAAAAHPEARLLRTAGGYGVSPTGGTAPAAKDPSRWWFGIYGLEGYPDIPAAAPAPAPESAPGGAAWASLDRLEPLPGVVPGPLTAALSWVYPHRAVSTLPAKVAPTALERLQGSGLEEDAAGMVAAEEAREAPPSIEAPAGEAGAGWAILPAFLAAAPAGPSPVERGRATHLLLQHADLGGPLDEEALAALAGSLADRELMTPEQARLADTRAVARFFASDLGRRLVAGRDKARREVPFTLALPAAEVYPELAPARGAAWATPAAEGAVATPAETVLVQGIIDAVLAEPDGLVILDFKTDRVTAAEAPARAEVYRTQVSLYRRALETALGQPVKAVYLYFLTPGVAVAVSAGPS